MAKIKNISNGPRGAYLGGQLIWAAVGEVIEADDFTDDWFEEVAGGSADEPDFGKMTKAQLIAFAQERGIEINPAENKPDILAAIELALEDAA